MNAEQAWQSVLGQLQMEMPRASFDTWVRDTRVVLYDEGIMTVGVRNAYARDWLESRLLSTVARLLAGMMDRTVDVRFVVTNGQDSIETDDAVAEVDTISDDGSPQPATVKRRNST